MISRRVPLNPSHTAEQRFTILCIEDDAAIARIYERRLCASGARILLSANGRDGFASAVEAAPDLILLDNDLPDEQGVDLVKRLRAHSATAHIPVLMVTGSHTSGIQRRMLCEGVIDVLEKPVNFKLLLDYIRQIASSSLAPRTPDAEKLPRDHVR